MVERVVELWVDCGEPFALLKDPRATAERMLKAYPDIDIATESRKVSAWWYANPSRRKTARGVPRFINGWFARAQPVQRVQSVQPQQPTVDASSLWGDDE